MSLEQEMIAFIKAGLEHHDATCPMPARAILLNAGNYELFGRQELFGLPLEPRDDIPPKRFRIDCPGSASDIENEIADALGEPLTVTPEREPERGIPLPGDPAETG
jgi:hypothetical protein